MLSNAVNSVFSLVLFMSKTRNFFTTFTELKAVLTTNIVLVLQLSRTSNESLPRIKLSVIRGTFTLCANNSH